MSEYTLEELNKKVIDIVGGSYAGMEISNPCGSLEQGAAIIFGFGIDLSHIHNRSGQVVAQIRGRDQNLGKVISQATADQNESEFPQLLAAMRCLVESRSETID